MSKASANPARQSPPHRSFPYLSGLSAQRIVELVALRLAPAATGAAIAYTHLDSEWQGLLVFACMFGVVMLLRSPHYPLHLIPFASASLYVLAPPLGALLAVLVSASDGSSASHLDAATMVPAVLGAWAVAGLGAFISTRFRRDREVRVAVIGSHEFARGLAAELEAVGARGYRVIGCIDPEKSCERDVVAGEEAAELVVALGRGYRSPLPGLPAAPASGRAPEHGRAARSGAADTGRRSDPRCD